MFYTSGSGTEFQFFFINAKEMNFEPQLTRFRGVLIKDFRIKYDNIKNLFFSPNFFLPYECQGDQIHDF